MSDYVPGASAQSIVVRPTEITTFWASNRLPNVCREDFADRAGGSAGRREGRYQELLGPAGDFSCILQEWSIYLYDRLVLC